ncbi:MAG TPA: hypothetical protein ENK15_00490 [Thermopetrobacter sp.]|nr:hypothetical protein [Thermopetrobacter sp.]
MLSPRAFAREARIVLARLDRNGGHLRCESAAGRAAWRMYSPRNRWRKPVMEPPAELVDAMIARGWLRAGDDGRFMLSPAGRRWLRAAPSTTGAGRQRQRREIVDPDGVRRTAEINDRESPVQWLARRRDGRGRPYLSAEEVAAAERLRRDYEHGRLGAAITSSWDAMFTAADRRRLRGAARDGLAPGERAHAARQRVWKALQAVGPGLDAILLEVCCLHSGLEAAERRLGWPRRSGRLVLQMALDRLARHYGLKKDAPVPRVARISAWSAPDGHPRRALPEEWERGEGGG